MEEAKHGYVFLKEHCIDREYGGIYWSLNYDGTPLDTTKHTYNQAFCIYALSSYYEASHDEEALALAKQLFSLIEEKCTDEVGYLEAFTTQSCTVCRGMRPWGSASVGSWMCLQRKYTIRRSGDRKCFSMPGITQS